MNTHLPHSVRLPGGYVVTIKTLAPSTMKRRAGEDVYGYFDSSERTIYVDKTVTEARQRYILSHEMQHALADWQHVYIGADRAP